MSSKTIIIAAMPNLLGQSPAFRKTTVPGSPNGNSRSLLGKTRSIALQPQVKREMVETTSDSSCSARKRQRLDHLSLEEKLLRRKLKNRVAAQTARDRKKAKMEELEDLVQHLELEREILKAENCKLKNVNMLLETENKFLKDKAEEVPSIVKDEVDRGSESFEQASFINAPLPKDQEMTIRPSLSIKHLICLQMMTTMMVSWIYSKNAAKSSSKTCTENALKMNYKKKLMPFIRRSCQPAKSMHPQIEWWGPQQKNWTPQKNNL